MTNLKRLGAAVFLTCALGLSTRNVCGLRIGTAAVPPGPSSKRVLSVTIEFRQDWKATGHRYHDIVAPLLLDMGVHHFDMLRMILSRMAA